MYHSEEECAVLKSHSMYCIFLNKCWAFISNGTFRTWRLNETGISLKRGAYFFNCLLNVQWTYNLSPITALLCGL